MTAEIVIINQQAVALAADSAVTIGKNKVWKHANKLFSAGPRNDIGVMVYNTGDFLSIPWEVIIKQHKNSICQRQFGRLEEFAEDFIEYVQSDKFKIPEQEKLSFQMIILDVIINLNSGAERKNKSDFEKSLEEEIDEDVNDIQSAAELKCPFKFKKFKAEFKETIEAISSEHFKYKLSSRLLNKLTNLVFEHIRHESMSDYFSGIVIAGYGKEELFPSVVHYTVDGKALGMTRVWRADKCINLNEQTNGGAAIIPFAQDDMAHLFMEGIMARYLQFTYLIISKLLDKRSAEVVNKYVTDIDENTVENAIQKKENQDIAQEFMNQFDNFRASTFTKAIMKTIRALPKEEMAYMARALVEITALRRRFASSVESVGGDIDVAIISKSDGFVWISRKHYFDIDFNPDFLHRRSTFQGE